MLNVNVKLYGNFRNILKKDSISMRVSNIEDVISKLKNLSNKETTKFLTKNTFFIVIDGEVVTNFKDYKLKENTTLHIFPIIGGG